MAFDVGLRAVLSPELDEKEAEREVETMGELMEEIEEVAPELDLSGVKEQLDDFDEEISLGVDGGALDDAMGTLTEDLGAFGSAIEGAAQKSGQGVGGMASGAASGFMEFAQSVDTPGVAGFLGTVALGGALAVGMAKTLDSIASAAPAWQKTKDMFGTALELFFRPIGRQLAKWLQPMARSMIRMGKDFNKNMRETEGTGMPFPVRLSRALGETVLNATGTGGIFGGDEDSKRRESMLTGAGIGGSIGLLAGGPMGMAIGTVMGGLIGGLSGLIDDLLTEAIGFLEGIKNTAIDIWNSIKDFTGFDPEDISVKLGGAVGDFLEDIDWDDYVDPLDWATWVGELTWSTFLSLLEWFDWIDELEWTTWLDPLKWATWVKKLVWDSWLKDLEWATWVDPLKWATWVKKLKWTTWVNKLRWGTWVNEINWGTHIDGVDLSNFVTPVNLANFVGGLFGGRDGDGGEGNGGSTGGPTPDERRLCERLDGYTWNYFRGTCEPVGDSGGRDNVETPDERTSDRNPSCGSGEYWNPITKRCESMHGGTPDVGLAEGGVVTGRTEAVLGEAGPEAVIPLENLGTAENGAEADRRDSKLDAIHSSLQELLLAIESGEDIVIEVDGEEMARAAEENKRLHFSQWEVNQ